MFNIDNKFTQKYINGEISFEKLIDEVYKEFNKYILNMIDEVFKDDSNK